MKTLCRCCWRPPRRYSFWYPLALAVLIPVLMFCDLNGGDWLPGPVNALAAESDGAEGGSGSGDAIISAFPDVYPPAEDNSLPALKEAAARQVRKNGSARPAGGAGTGRVEGDADTQQDLDEITGYRSANLQTSATASWNALGPLRGLVPLSAAEEESLFGQ